MSSAEVRYQVDEYGHLAYRVTNEGVLLSKEEKELIIDRFTALQTENARLRAKNGKLRELVQGLWFAAQYLGMNPDDATGSGFARQIRELGVEI